jgi:AcrR family transcriptional regulator
MGRVKMDGPLSRRERKKRETRQRLLECAWQLALDQGYDETTVEEITEAADVAKGTFFNYFATKEVLLDELALWRLELLGQHVRASGDASQSVVARIKRTLIAIADELFPEGDLPRHLLLARISAPIKHESAHRLGSMVRELVAQGQERDEIRADVDADLIARLLMTGVFYHFMHAHPEHTHRGRTSVGDSSTGDTAVQEAPAEEGESRSTQYALDLEEKLIESVDTLMGGLGGPQWRKS